MITQLLKERLTKTESLAHQILVGLAAVYVFSCRFTQSGPVGWLDKVQTNRLDGEYYPVLNLLLCLALFVVPLSGLFLLYAHLKKSINQMMESMMIGARSLKSGNRNIPFVSLLVLLVICMNCGHAQLPTSGQGQTTTATIPSLREQIYSQVREGNTLEALDLLEKTNPQDAQLLKTQFERAHEDFSRGLIGFDDLSMTLARLHYASLEMAPGEAAAEKPAIPRDQVSTLAEAGELETALQLLLPAIEQDATLLFARLHSTGKYYQQGLVSEEQLERLKLNIKFAILEMAE